MKEKGKKDEGEDFESISEREEDKEPLAPEVRELVHYLYNEASLTLKERISGINNNNFLKKNNNDH